MGNRPLLLADVQTKLGMLCSIRRGTLKAQIPGTVQRVLSLTSKGDEEIQSTEKKN